MKQKAPLVLHYLEFIQMRELNFTHLKLIINFSVKIGFPLLISTSVIYVFP